MQTVLKEIEAVLNTRPLVYVDDDVSTAITLTPANFLGGNILIGIPHLDVSDDDDVNYVGKKLSSKEALLERWKTGQRHLNAFWKVWAEEYLLSLRERHNQSHKRPRVAAVQTPSIGDIVIVKDEAHSRNHWKLGRIVKLHTSHDSEHRSAAVKTGNGRTVNRPINLLYPIECPATKDQEVSEMSKDDIEGYVTRPRRSAAEKARYAIGQYFRSGS